MGSTTSFNRPFPFAGLCIFALAITLVLVQTSRAADVTLAWNASSDASLTGYKVYYGVQSRTYPNALDVGKTTTHTVTGLQEGATYYFAVTAYNASRSESGYSNEVSKATTPTPSTVNLTLTWNASTDAGLAGYKVYYGVKSRTYPNALDVGKTTTHTVTGLQEGATYYFAVTAYNASRLESAYSNEVSRQITTACIYSISPTSQSFPSAGGSATVGVAASQGCSWSSSSGVSWVTITSGQSGSGNGTVVISVAANTGGPRAAGIAIANRTFTINQDAATPVHTITASAATGGTISPSGTISVKAGASLTFNIVPNARYRILRVLVDGKSVGAVSTYTFTNVKADHTIRARFRLR